MSGPWFLALVAAVAGVLVVLRGSRIVGGALLAGAALVAMGIAEVDLPSRPGTASASGGHDRDPWVLRVTLDQAAPATLPATLSERWVDVPNVGTARPDAQGRVVVRGEPDSGYVEMNAVKLALRELPHVESVERIR